MNHFLNIKIFYKKLWICFLILLIFPSCRRGSFDRIKESSFQYFCKEYLLFCEYVVAKIDMFDCDPLHNTYEKDGTHYIDREVLADDLTIEKEEKIRKFSIRIPKKIQKRKIKRHKCRLRKKYSNRST
ncbi:hypothetical protein LEP1GSC150_5040 [Leptospira interrogans serovar Copenhageni str. LT2050]|uniref:Uncharacterized protein n=1 Tax=Leptospira interrogans serovar Copenhageni str. LT2050 TaxID=1001598 RepID=M3HWY7_LEPIT|nr:hypothetical protein LEP1GSC150_5040 [Leptospira interrogans serovar Copenhageni str. LT2050]